MFEKTRFFRVVFCELRRLVVLQADLATYWVDPVNARDGRTLWPDRKFEAYGQTTRKPAVRSRAEPGLDGHLALTGQGDSNELS